MKNNTLLLLLLLIIAASCHKSHSSSPQAAYSFPMNGVTGMRLRMQTDSAGMYGAGRPVTWAFRGTSPLVAFPVSDSIHFGSVQITFTGQNATQLLYSHDSQSFHNNATISVSYNAHNLPDTVYAKSQLSSLLGINRQAYVFEYTDTLVSKITLYKSAGSFWDTFRWASPVAQYYYYYNGSDIAQQVVQYLNSGVPYYSDTLRYTSGIVKNNLSRCIPFYLLLEFMGSLNGNTGTSGFATHLPLYFSAATVAAVSGTWGADPNAYNYLTDTKGRITGRIAPVSYTFDTTSFYYHN